jgi:hypothetical protein
MSWSAQLIVPHHGDSLSDRASPRSQYRERNGPDVVRAVSDLSHVSRSSHERRSHHTASGETMGSTPGASPQGSPRWPVSTTFRARARQRPSWSPGGRHLGDADEVTRSNGAQVIRTHCCEAALGFHVKAKGLETRLILGPCFKQCSSTASSNAHRPRLCRIARADGHQACCHSANDVRTAF